MLKCALPGPHNTLSIMVSIVVTREGEKPHSATLPINKAAACKTLWENNSKRVLLKVGACKANHCDNKENNYFSRCFQDAFAAADIISRHFLKYCWNPALALMKSSLLSLLIGNPINRSLFYKCLTAGILCRLHLNHSEVNHMKVRSRLVWQEQLSFCCKDNKHTCVHLIVYTLTSLRREESVCKNRISQMLRTKPKLNTQLRVTPTLE